MYLALRPGLYFHAHGGAKQSRATMHKALITKRLKKLVPRAPGLLRDFTCVQITAYIFIQILSVDNSFFCRSQ